MLLLCRAKGCCSENNHLLNLSDNTVYCIDCGEPLNVPKTTITTLKTLGQVRRPAKKAWQFECLGCGFSGRPEIKRVSGVNVAECSNCGKAMDNVPGSFIQAMKAIGPEDWEGNLTEGGDEADGAEFE